MIRYLVDYEEQCKRCKGECRIEGMSGSIICHGFVPETNADNIRSMTDEQLAELLYDIGDCDSYNLECKGGRCRDCWLDWLRRECGC